MFAGLLLIGYASKVEAASITDVSETIVITPSPGEVFQVQPGQTRSVSGSVGGNIEFQFDLGSDEFGTFTATVDGTFTHHGVNFPIFGEKSLGFLDENTSHTVTIPIAASSVGTPLPAGSYSSSISEIDVFVTRTIPTSIPPFQVTANVTAENNSSDWSIEERVVPEPLTILGSLTVAGFLPLLKKTKK